MVTNAGIRWRRSLRLLRSQPPTVQALAAGVSLLLVVNVALVGVRSSTDEVGSPRISGPAAAEDDSGTSDGSATSTDAGGAHDADDEPGGDDTEGTDGAESTDGADVSGEADGSGTDATDGGTDGGSTSTDGSETATTSGSGTSTGSEGSSTTGSSDGDPDPVPGRTYTASDRGVTADSVKIVFPWFDLAATFAVTGSSNDDIENAENVIHAMVDWINDHGGIDGRAIDPIIEEFNPLNEADMRTKCIDWTQDQEVFGVVDAGGWHAQHQLCIAQENDTPLISEWTTEEEWTERGDPYLWWSAASANDTIDNLLLWIREQGLETEAPVGVLFADREGDNLAREYLEAVNEQVGMDLHIETIPYDNAAAQAAVPQAVQRMRTADVTRVIGLLPLTTMAFWLSGAESQDFYPHYVLSDYETNLVTAQALLGAQFPESLHGALGPTSFPLGQIDDPSNYRPAERECNDIWKSQSPESADLDIGGVGMRWCQNIFLFVEAASAASEANGGFLTRDNWAQAMGQIRDRPSQMTPIISFSPTDRSGPTMVKVVEVRTEGCTPAQDDDNNGVCHVEVSGYEPYREV